VYSKYSVIQEIDKVFQLKTLVFRHSKHLSKANLHNFI